MVRGGGGEEVLDKTFTGGLSNELKMKNLLPWRNYSSLKSENPKSSLHPIETPGPLAKLSEIGFSTNPKIIAFLKSVFLLGAIISDWKKLS